MYAILSIMVGLVNDGNGGLHTEVWADLFWMERFDNPITCYSAQEIEKMLPPGYPTTAQHLKLAVLNHVMKKGFKLGPIGSYRNSSNIERTDYYLEIQPHS